MARRLAFSADEVAALLGVASTTLDRWIRNKTIASFTVGRRRFIARDTLAALCRGERPAVPDPPAAA